MSISEQAKKVKSLQTKLWISFLLYQYNIGLRQVIDTCKAEIRKSTIEGWFKGDMIATVNSVETMESYYLGSREPYFHPLFVLLLSGPLTPKAALKILKRYCPRGATRLDDLQFPPINSFRYNELEELDWSAGFYEQCLAARGDIHTLSVCLALTLVSEYTKIFVDQQEGYCGICWALPPVLSIPWVWPHRNLLVSCVFDAVSIEDSSGGLFCGSIEWDNITYHASKFKRSPVAYRKKWPDIVRLRDSVEYPAFSSPVALF